MDLTWAQDAAWLGQGASLGVLVAVGIAGLRHGFDIDHIAAISDIVSSQRSRRRSFTLATSYAVGHIIVVCALGGAAVVAGVRISGWSAAIASRLIGLTLISLGIYVLYSLVRFRRDFRMMSRWMLVTASVRRVLRWIRPPRQIVIEHAHPHDPGHHDDADHGAAADHSISALHALPSGVTVAAPAHAHRHRHVVAEPSDPFTEYSGPTSFLVGMIHGIGAETPTQLILFTAAAGVAGSRAALALVGAFAAGLLLGNLVLTVLVSSGVGAGRRMPLVYLALAGVTAAFSLWVGGAYLLGRPDLLPPLLGGHP